MNRWLVFFALTLWSTSLVIAGALGDPAPPVTKHIEIAGTLVIDGASFILKSNGHEYLLSLDPTEPGVSTMKTGTALIVKGALTITEVPGEEKVRSLRPEQIIIRGRVYFYEATPALEQ